MRRTKGELDAQARAERRRRMATDAATVQAMAWDGRTTVDAPNMSQASSDRLGRPIHPTALALANRLSIAADGE